MRGRGWRSGRFALILALMALGSLACFTWPETFTTHGFRARYPVPLIIFLTRAFLVGAIALGVVGIGRKRGNVEAWLGFLLGIVGLLHASFSGVLYERDVGEAASPFGLDWFLVNILAMTALFVPLERVRPLRREQPGFRAHWRMDLTYFAVSHVFVQALILVTIVPVTRGLSWARALPVAAHVGALPAVVQFVIALVVADLTQYGVHRLFHRLPALWRFHSIHHGIESMDWLASSRLHLVDIVVTRALVFIPIFVLGFSDAVIAAYVSFVSLHAVFLHLNLRIGFGPIERVLVTPRYHHWHHAIEREAIDKNFALHFAWIDRLFGTQYLPKGRWPRAYGISHDPPPQRHYLAQFLWSFRRRRGP